ncbi:MAG TPA: energy transducer TonB [Thermoanaerobaculia bacterium]
MIKVSFRLILLATIALAATSCARETSAPKWFGQCGSLDVAELGEADVAPQLRDRVEPKIKERPALGPVLLEVILDAQGNVCDARVVKPLQPQLDAAALEAVRQWKFAPAQKGGKPVAARYFASIEYRRPGAPPAGEEEDWASPAHPPTNT